MNASAAFRMAVGHVRTPLYFNAYALIASNAITSLLGLVYWSVAANLLTTVSIGLQSAAISMICLLYTSPSPRDGLLSRMPSSA